MLFNGQKQWGSHADETAGSYCVYPPRTAQQIEITEQSESGASTYVLTDHRSSQYFILKNAEYCVFQRIDGSRTAVEIGLPVEGRGPRASRKAVVSFLSKLDSFGLLARGGAEPAREAHHDDVLYNRIRLVDPDRFLAWLDGKLGWVFSRVFAYLSIALMAVITIELAMKAAEVANYTSYTYSEYGLVLILILSVIITSLHEVAHGLACKHFGGRVREIGVLMIFYVVPAFYCNVSDMYRLKSKRQRMLVIFAGIYFQLAISAVAALVWLIAAPFTPLADAGFIVFAAGAFNILINCNPLIKLDGYYALVQLTGIANLQSRAFGYVKGLVKRAVDGPQVRIEAHGITAAFFMIYSVCSVVYSVVLVWAIAAGLGEMLMDWFGFTGVVLTLLLFLLLIHRLLKVLWKRLITEPSRRLRSVCRRQLHRLASGITPMTEVAAVEGASRMSQTEALQKTDKTAISERTDERPTHRASHRPRVIKASLALVTIAALVVPWEASTGSDCTLMLPSGRETSARAHTEALLAEVLVQPGDVIAEGTKLARLSSTDLEDRLTQMTAEIARLNANSARIEDELRVRSETTLSASLKEREKEQLAREFRSEMDQVSRSGAYSGRSETPADTLPAALAVLRSEVELKQVELAHNRLEVERYQKLLDQGLVGSRQYDAAAAAARMSEKELQRAKSRFEAALVEHRRMAGNVETSSLVAQTEARAARSSFEALIAEMQSNREQLKSLRVRREILQREFESMNVVAPRAGVILGEDLRKTIGRKFSRGEEICRVGDLKEFILKIDVSEREIGNVRIDSPVRFKLKTVPGRTFTGHVSKINAEAVMNQHGQRFYAVEVAIQNDDGILRPGMTGFARISFGRQSVGLILAEKVWHALRPELWLF